MLKLLRVTAYNGDISVKTFDFLILNFFTFESSHKYKRVRHITEKISKIMCLTLFILKLGFKNLNAYLLSAC